MASNTSGKKLSAAQARQQAIALRVKGHSYREIADMVGRNYTTVYQYISREMKALARATRRDAEELRAIEDIKLEQLEDAAWKNAMKGDVQSIRAIVKIMERRAKLFGLDLGGRNLGEDPDDPDLIDAPVRYVVMKAPPAASEEEWQKYALQVQQDQQQRKPITIDQDPDFNQD